MDSNQIQKLQKLSKIIQNSKDKYKSRTQLPQSKQKFLDELNEAAKHKQTKTQNFVETMSQIKNFFEDKNNNMFNNGLAYREGWYDLITCEEQLWQNYNILKEYAHYLSVYVDERMNSKDGFAFIKQSYSNLVFLVQIRTICNITYLGLTKGKELLHQTKNSHEYFDNLIYSVIQEILIWYPTVYGDVQEAIKELQPVYDYLKLNPSL